MEIKLDYIPEKVYRLFNYEIQELNLVESNRNITPLHDYIYYSGRIIIDKWINIYIGQYHKPTKNFFLDGEFFLTKKEAYDAHVKELENQIKELNDKALKLQMEALDTIGDLNYFMEQYKELEENE